MDIVAAELYWRPTLPSPRRVKTAAATKREKKRAEAAHGKDVADVCGSRFRLATTRNLKHEHEPKTAPARTNNKDTRDQAGREKGAGHGRGARLLLVVVVVLRSSAATRGGV